MSEQAWQDRVYRCDWCGRFYSSPLPEGSACADHIPEHNERLRRSIERHNNRLLPLPPPSGANK